MSEGLKYDSSKNRYDLIPWDVIDDIVKIFTYGANKYEENNWKLLDKPYDRYFAAAMRHLVEYRNGKKLDDESGMPHLAHAATNLIFMMWFDKQQKYAPGSVIEIEDPTQLIRFAI